MEKEINWLLKEKYNNKPSEKFYKDVERLKAGEPVDYVIGFTEFLGCKINLSKKPLIPRQETEYWVGQVLKNLKKGKALDIFSGSGCIGISILKNIKNIKVDFAEKDKEIIKQIKINLKLNQPSGPKGTPASAWRSKVIESDVFKNVVGKYDYIFANPPYIPKAKIKKIQKSVLKFEPKEALFGGSDGLYYIRKFLKDAKNHLNDGGVIFMEFDPPLKKEIENLIKKNKYSNCKFYKDQYKRWRWVKIVKNID